MSSVLRFALPVLAVARSAHADCSASATTTIQNSGDASAFASCTTFSGSIAIATGTTDDISLDGIQVLKGNLVVHDNDQIKRLGSSSLEDIQGDFDLSQVQGLVGVDFGSLTSVKNIKWEALPMLAETGFTKEISKADTVSIQNTGLTSLKGINLEEVDEMFIANNQEINEINMQLTNVTTRLDFSDNNDELRVSLENLTNANNLTFRFCGSIDLPNVEKIGGSLGLYDNKIGNFSAPSLTEIGEALALVANEEMSNVSFPALKKVSGNLMIANNTKLDEVEGFPKLETISASFDLSGNMTNVDTPKLKTVGGAFNLQSTGDVTKTCENFQNMKDEGDIRGKFFCEGEVINPGQEGTDPDKKDDSESAASSLNPQNAALGLAALAAVFIL